MKTTFPQSHFSTPENALNLVLDNIYNGIAVFDKDVNCIKVNSNLSKLLGYSKKEFLEMSIKDITFKEDLNEHHKKYRELLNGEISQYQIEQRYFHKKGSIKWMLVSVSLINNFNLNDINTIWQFTDITEQKNQFGQVKTMLNVVREKNDRLTTFAEIITHNLRSHFGNLATISEFLKEDHPILETNESFSMMQKAIENFGETVNHLNEVAQVKAVKSSEIRPLNLYEFVEKAINNIAALAKGTDSKIINKINKKFYVKGVPAYLDSIILNFLTNAIKYRSEKRSPIIELNSSLQNEFVVFSIKDNGLGIDLDKYGDKLFHMYKTFHCNDDARGIGLFITKNHIESLGGRVIVTSEVEAGTEFSVFLKRA